MVPVGHEDAQLPNTHELPPAHTLPQPPQLAGSVVVSTQAPAQTVSPVGQAHLPLTQCRPGGQR
jgi:hypothetical protein